MTPGTPNGGGANQLAGTFRVNLKDPIGTDGRIALPVGNANDHRLSGVLDIWRIPS